MNKPIQPASMRRQYFVKPQELPLSCPTKQMRIWDAHPRVYLPIEETGREVCPYCGAEFILQEGEQVESNNK